MVRLFVFNLYISAEYIVTFIGDPQTLHVQRLGRKSPHTENESLLNLYRKLIT